MTAGAFSLPLEWCKLRVQIENRANRSKYIYRLEKVWKIWKKGCFTRLQLRSHDVMALFMSRNWLPRAWWSRCHKRSYFNAWLVNSWAGQSEALDPQFLCGIADYHLLEINHSSLLLRKKGTCPSSVADIICSCCLQLALMIVSSVVAME